MMEIKTIEQIQSEVSNDMGYQSWGDLTIGTSSSRDIYNSAFRMVTKRHASQFQQQNEVLRDRISELEGFIEDISSNYKLGDKPSWKQLSEIRTKTKSLINKGR